MGREIYCEIRKKTPIVAASSADSDEYGYDEEDRSCVKWDSAENGGMYVCGRDDATNYLSCLGGNEGLIPIRGKGELHKILDELETYAKADEKEIDKAKQCLRDLKSARRNARNYKDFSSFTDAIEDVERWIEDNDWSRALILMRIITHSYEEFSKHPLKYRGCELCIVISE